VQTSDQETALEGGNFYRTGRISRVNTVTGQVFGRVNPPLARYMADASLAIAVSKEIFPSRYGRQ
jgi:hypothetical protein